MKKYKIGDKVEIISNIPSAYKHRIPFLGKVVRIEGEYHYVRPLWANFEMELYRSEIRHWVTRKEKISNLISLL